MKRQKTTLIGLIGGIIGGVITGAFGFWINTSQIEASLEEVNLQIEAALQLEKIETCVRSLGLLVELGGDGSSNAAEAINKMVELNCPPEVAEITKLVEENPKIRDAIIGGDLTFEFRIDPDTGKEAIYPVYDESLAPDFELLPPIGEPIFVFP